MQKGRLKEKAKSDLSSFPFLPFGDVGLRLGGRKKRGFLPRLPSLPPLEFTVRKESENEERIFVVVVAVAASVDAGREGKRNFPEN